MHFGSQYVVASGDKIETEEIYTVSAFINPTCFVETQTKTHDWQDECDDGVANCAKEQAAAW